MPEAGGSSTQSGIIYQNTWAALYLCRLINPNKLSASDSVISVQVEALESVDDIVVTFRSGEKHYIQAKENVSSTGRAWKKLWSDIKQQYENNKYSDFQIVLAFGSNKPLINDLKEICLRTRNRASLHEWYSGLTHSQTAILKNIASLFQCEDEGYLFDLFKKLDVLIWPLETLVRDYSPIFIPSASCSPTTLLSTLRDLVGDLARSRGTFNQADLLDKLFITHKISINESSQWGLGTYKTAINKATAKIQVPGTNISGDISKLFIWLPLLKRDREDKHRDFEEEDLRWRYIAPRKDIRLNDFPRTELKRVIVDASAGFGKSVLVQAIAHKLTIDNVYVPALIPLDQLAESEADIIQYLNESLNQQMQVSIDWLRLSEGGRSVILFDGLDELSEVNRTRIINRIGQFSARFPLVPWVLTVRDGSILSSPLDAERLDIARLDDSSLLEFAKSYSNAGSKISKETLENHLYENTDLNRLLRIPLFLAIVLSMGKSEDSLPSSRVELLEDYLSLLFAPHRFKPRSFHYGEIDELRDVGEYLAFQGLETGSIGFSEQDAKAILSQANFSETSGTYLSSLVQHGVLYRRGHRVRFTFPIIQEYLASCWIRRNCPELIASRFNFVIQRPWAQTLQFCLEQYSGAEEIVKNQISKPDDAFNTVLRLIGRSIVNGMPISNDLKNEVGRKLAEVWVTQSQRYSDKIGRLIADGFTSPLPSIIEENLRRGRGISQGGAEIITVASNPELTRSALEGYLNYDLERRLWLHGWQDAVNDIAGDAFALFVDRSRKEYTSAEEISSISNLMLQLPKSRIEKSLLNEVKNDNSLHLFIRLAAFDQAEQLSPRSYMAEITRYLRKEDGISTWERYRAVDFFWHIEGAEEEYISITNDDLVDQETVNDLTYELTIIGRKEYAVGEILRKAYGNLDSARKKRIAIFAGLLGDKSALHRLIEEIPDLPQELVNILAWYVGHLSLEDSLLLLEKLRLRIPVSNEPISFANLLFSGISYKFDLRMALSGVLDNPIKHPAYEYFLPFVFDLLNTQDLSYSEEVHALAMLKELGVPGSDQFRIVELLDISLKIFLQETEDETEKFGREHPVETCLELLDDQAFIKNKNKIKQIITDSSFNLSRSALRLLCSKGDISDLHWLIDTYKISKSEIRSNIFDYIDELASRCQKCLRLEDSVLTLSDW